MDFTLFTFMLQTSPSTKSVNLIGSWDNFSRPYPMERDDKRSRGQWRGCYTFEDIICDGDGRCSPKRTGGLKMGSTYYYYYELDHGTEYCDPSIPFTTSCPYLPGQPVNLLSVPIEVQSLRHRSASMSSMENSDLKTMNPAHKYMSPRETPTLPMLTRVNTSPPNYSRKRPSRSLSPRHDRQWSPRNFFGLRSPLPSPPVHDVRGRSSSLSKMSERDLNTIPGTMTSQPGDPKRMRSHSLPRSPSSSSLRSSSTRQSSPPRHKIERENNGYQNTNFTISDILEDFEDDDNFACELHRDSFHEKGHTQLSPPPRLRRVPSRSLSNTSKPLPDLPSFGEKNHSRSARPKTPAEEDSRSFIAPGLLHPVPERAPRDQRMPRSHFSVSTVNTGIISPSDSSFCFSEIADDEEFSADIESGDDTTYSPVLENGKGFSGYSLPEQDHASEHTLRKHTPLSHLSATTGRNPFGASGFAPMTTAEAENMTALEQLMSEMGYLGNVIIGK